eukprot:1537728-Rhodomonas_salina.1
MCDPDVDINVICSKFLAFRAPNVAVTCLEPDDETHVQCLEVLKQVAVGQSTVALRQALPSYPGSPPSLYVKHFQALDVRLVVRLNRPDAYDAEEAFVSQGIEHADLECADYSAPSDELLEHFLDLVDAHRDGMVAVHDGMEGLFSTGTLIAAWAMKHYK